jgi:hypothetical protein
LKPSATRSSAKKQPSAAIPSSFTQMRQRVSAQDQVKKWLAGTGDEARQAAFADIRENVEKVTIHPRGLGESVGIEIDGQLAAILRLSDTVTGAGESQGGDGCGETQPPILTFVGCVYLRPMLTAPRLNGRASCC